MASKPKRRMGRYIRGAVDEELSLTTLGAKTVASVQFDNVVNERTLVSSIVAAYTLENFTKAADDGPIAVGVAHGDYSAAEIEEYLENLGSWDEGNKIAQEQNQRKIRRIGIFRSPEGILDNIPLQGGKQIKTKLNWILNQGQTMQLWAYNMGTSSIATTVPVVHAQGHANLFPR